ncbi:MULTISPECIES: histidine kinase [unclassified Vibrio]|uniref:histidine kinase n=1 Tax=unclassified Vibrio TaxID=2614977 RepID=UPI000C83F6F6|nr:MULTISPECIES: histidine kinase [unclassified Vibrio]MCC4889003.1 histidine kinase [Vibrio sp. F13]PMK78169.1 histidine kinase [Vibrio sp. 10N.261.52.E5]TKF82898.1 histidine kinase [Vibrio sp. F13]
MNQVEVLYALMNRIVSDLNKRLPVSLVLHQQQITTKNISLSGANGRVWVSPCQGGYDISISGISLENDMTARLTSYFGRNPDGYKQRNATRGFERQPFWRTSNFLNVEVVCEMYAKTTQ